MACNLKQLQLKWTRIWVRYGDKGNFITTTILTIKIVFLECRIARRIGNVSGEKERLRLPHRLVCKLAEAIKVYFTKERFMDE